MRPPDFIDYYDILGLSPGATEEDVREAWRRCARLYHPDLNPRKTSFRFRRAKEAYDVLIDPARRRDFDRMYRLRKGVMGRAAGARRRTGSYMGTPPGGRTPPGPSTRASGTPKAGSSASSSARSPRTGSPSTSASTAGAAPNGSAASGKSKPPTGARTPGSGSMPGRTGGTTSPPPGARSTSPPGAGTGKPSGAGSVPGSAEVKTRTTFRPATVFREVRGAGVVDYLKEAVTHGGASRVTVRHNGNVVWETHITSALMDDLARWLVGPLTALLRLLGQEAQFRIELTNELVEDYNQGNTLYDQGKLEEAKAAYKRCIERDKYFAPAHLSLGAVYEAQQDIPIAIKCYQNAVKIDPAGEAGSFARENLRRLRGY